MFKKPINNGTLFTVHAKPRSKLNGVLAWLDETTVKIATTSAPEKGKANESILKILAETLDVPPSSLTLVRGFSTSLKQIRYNGL